MSEQGNTSAIVKTPIEGEYLLEAKEYDASGKTSMIRAPLPDTGEFAKWSLIQQALMLKKGAWSGSPFSEIIFAIAYANSKGLDILAGDVYSTGSGRIATSNKAKIKQALATNRIEGIETEITQLNEDIALVGCPLKKDIECKATIHIKGWKAPIIRKSRLSRWFNAKNPNWKDRPEHMLELNTVAHALEFVNPTATEDDEAPPIIANAAVTTAVQAAITQADKGDQK
jgi:hypothetical protein